MSDKKYFTYKEALQDVIEVLEEHTDFFYDDIVDIAFNSDYYIIGTHESKKALIEYDVFKALEKIEAWQIDMFGKTHPNSDPEQLANMLYYIIGEQVLLLEPFNTSFRKVYGQLADDETNAMLIEKIKETIAVLESDGN